MNRRRMLVVLLTIGAVVIQFVQGADDERQTASARTNASPRAVVVSPSPVQAAPKPAVTISPKPVLPTLSPSPSPSPKGPPFVLDAAPSCAGKTALIDIQVAGTAVRPIMRLELFLDGAASSLTPAPVAPVTSYAGRSSGGAAPGGSGQWMIRAFDKEGFADTRVYPYACG